MANIDAPMGFNPVGKIGSGPPQKASEYNITNDVIFQGDPFPDLPRSRAYIFHENRAIHTEKHNGNWIKTGWPTIAGSTNGKCILNSGTLGGGPSLRTICTRIVSDDHQCARAALYHGRQEFLEPVLAIPIEDDDRRFHPPPGMMLL